MTPDAQRRRAGGLLVVVALAVLIVAGAGLALLLSRSTGGSSEAGPGAGVLPTAPASVPVTTARATVRVRPRPAAGAWPVGATGFTVVLATLSKKGHPRAVAQRVADAILVPGVSAHVLDSNAHPLLRPDVWIIWAGRYTTRAPAERLARQLRGAGARRGIVERLTG